MSGEEGGLLARSWEGLQSCPAPGTGLQLNSSRSFRAGDAQPLPYCDRFSTASRVFFQSTYLEGSKAPKATGPWLLPEQGPIQGHPKRGTEARCSPRSPAPSDA